MKQINFVIMKKILLALITFTITFSSIAQTKKLKEKNGTTQKNKEFKGDALEKLNLTKDQKNQLKVINQDFKQQMESLKTSNTTAKDGKEKREALVKEHEQKVDAILTPEQRMKAAEFRSVSKEQGSHHSKGKHGEARFEKVTKDLDLTADQQTKIKALNETLRSDAQNIEKNNALTEAQKKEQLKSVRKKHKQELNSLLTNEQKAKLKIRMKDQPTRKAVK